MIKYSLGCNNGHRFEAWFRSGDAFDRQAQRQLVVCPDCGSTVFWELSGFHDVIAVAVGGFADPSFPAPKVSVYEQRRHAWLAGLDAPGMQHLE